MPPLQDARYRALGASLEDGCRELDAAATAEQYQAIHDVAQAAVPRAQEIAAPELVFRAWTLVAMAAFALALDASGADAKDGWLMRAYDALLAAAGAAAPAPPADWLLRFASAIADVYAYMRNHYWPDETKAQIQGWEHRLAQAAETVLPIALVDPADHARGSEIARGLASLSYAHGKSEMGRARLDFAIAHAKQAGALQSWLDALYARYGYEKHRESHATTRLSQVTSLEDLDAWIQDQTASEPSQRLPADNRRELRALAEVFRASFRSRAGRLWAAQHIAEMQAQFIEEELAGDEAASTVFDAVDATKARLLFDYLTTHSGGISSSHAAEQALEIDQQILGFAPEAARDKGNTVLSEMRLVSALPIGSYVGDTFDPRQKEHRRALIAALEEVYARQGAGFVGGTRPLASAGIAAALDPDEAIVEYYLPSNRRNPSEQHIHIFVLTHERLYVGHSVARRDPARKEWMAGTISIDGRQPLDMDLVGEQVASMRLAIRNGDDARADGILQRFYPLLIGPLLEAGLRPADFRRWIIVPHARLHALPFAALRAPGGRPLVEDVALTIAPSASVWYVLQAGIRPPATSFVGFANPLLFDADLPPLPEAETEVAHICDSLAPLERTVLAAEEATETAVQRQTPGKSVIHFATHGDFPASDVIDLHRLLLAPTLDSDGRLLAQEIRHLDLHAARLVALSICNGGVYRVGPGDEPYGLLQGLLVAGAENVVGTLWPIEDQFGRAFMVEMYEHLLDAGPAEAHRQACLRLIREGKPLRAWAGWVLVGPGRPW